MPVCKEGPRLRGSSLLLRFGSLVKPHAENVVKFHWLFIFALAGSLTVVGCSLVHSHRKISPPSGCNRCHEKPIDGNWHVLFKPTALHDERDPRAHVESPGRPRSDGGPLRCFTCHHTPDRDHLLYQGVYEHQ